jgi:hypothetical protein
LFLCTDDEADEAEDEEATKDDTKETTKKEAVVANKFNSPMNECTANMQHIPL